MNALRPWGLATLLCVVALGCDVPIDDGSSDGDAVIPSGNGTPAIPTPTGTCPKMATGTVKFNGQSVQLYVGPAGKPGPLLLYWHATGMTALEVLTGFGGAISEVQKNGGVVASFASTTMSGANTGNFVWYTGDFKTADEVVACGVQQGLVDPMRIHTSGYSAGGLQCGTMVFQRSGYLASAVCMSGGIISMMDMLGTMYKFQDASHVPPVVAAHGAQGLDWIAVDFATCSADLCKRIAAKGGTAINCNDGGDHIMGMITRAGTMGPLGWRWMKETPFGTNPKTLPTYFPKTCSLTN